MYHIFQDRLLNALIMFKEVFKKITLLVIAAAGVFIILEFVLFRTILGLTGLEYFEIVKYDRILGWRLKNNFEGRHKELEWDVRFKTNSNGFRDEEHRLEKDKKRIIILGDSIAEGYGVRYDDVFANIIRNKLGADFEIFNFGVRGYDIIQEYKCFLETGLQYKPDIVIQVLCDNDFSSGGMSQSSIFDAYLRYRPVYVIEGDKIVFSNAAEPYYREDAKKKNKYISQYKNYLLNFATIAYIRMGAKKILSFFQSKKNKKNNLINAYDRNYNKAVQIIYKDINRLKNENNFKFIMVTAWNNGCPPRELKNIADENSIYYLNVQLGPNDYFRYNRHPNSVGHRKIADEILNFLENNLL